MEQPAGAVAEEQPETEAVVGQLGTSEAAVEEERPGTVEAVVSQLEAVV